MGLHLVASMLFSVQPLDPAAFGAAVLLLLSSGALACLVPARRAHRVDPMTAIRAD